jgi:hypothetical protein
MSRILPIVEGYGELAAVPLLMRRVLQELHGRFDVEVLSAQRRGECLKVKREFERYYLSARLEQASILWVLDYDCEECTDWKSDREWMLDAARRLDPSGLVDIAFMVQEFESIFLWDLAHLVSAYGEAGMSTGLPIDPESVRDAKGFISRMLPKGRVYKPMADQARITKRLDLDSLRARSPSLQRFEQALLRLV